MEDLEKEKEKNKLILLTLDWCKVLTKNYFNEKEENEILKKKLENQKEISKKLYK